MSQATFGDDDLFGEAANEMREDVESSLEDGPPFRRPTTSGKLTRTTCWAC